MNLEKEKQDNEFHLNFNHTVERVLLEHSRISNYKLGWKLLLDKDDELLNVISESDHKYVSPIFFMINLNVLRIRFISMLQLEYPYVQKSVLLKLLNVKNVKRFI